MATAQDRERPRSRPPRPPSAMSAASFTADAIDRLNELSKCQHCNSLMVDPRQLPCHHSFCASCIRGMISSALRNEFLCPLDRVVIPVPARGMDAFPSDQRLKALEDIRIDLEQSLLLEEPETADLDINLESLNKGVKDIEHSSAMSQHEVNTMFESIYKLLKKKQETFLENIKRKSSKQVSLLEFEKFRLVETKKYQSEQLNDSTFYEEDVNVIFEPFGSESISNTNPPSPNSSVFSRNRNTISTASDPRLAMTSCHIGQQHLQFQPNPGAVRKLEEHLDELGRVICDFDLKIRLDRNLLALSDFPFGMRIGGEEKHPFDWQANQPKGISKRQMSTSLYVVNSGRSEIVQMDNSFNVMRIISGRGLFSNNLSDVASCGSHIYVADAGACQILMLNEDGTLVKRVGKAGTRDLEFKRPNGICVDSRGRVIVADSLNHRIKVLTADLQKCVMTITSDGKRFRDGKNFSFPCGVAVDKDDNIYVVDTNNKRLVQLSKSGKFMKEIFPADVDDPRCVTVSSNQIVLMTDRERAQVLIFDLHGNTTTRVLGIMNSQGHEVKFKQPYGIAVDGTDKVYVTDIERDSVFVL